MVNCVIFTIFVLSTMTNFISTYSIDFNNMSLIDGSYIKPHRWMDIIEENGGSFIADNQYIVFKSGDTEVVIDFELSVSGWVDYDGGDYYTPPSSDGDIDDVDISINGITVDEIEVEMSPDIKKMAKKAISDILN